TIQGGDVTILATASNKQILKASDFGTTAGAKFGAKVLNTIVTLLNKLAVEVAITYARADASIDIGSDATTPTIINAANFTAYASSTATASASPIKAWVVAFGVGVISTDAHAKIDNARITTTGDATIRASVDHTMKVSGKASSVEDVPFQGAAAVSV